MIVLGLDLDLRTGWAVMADSELIACDVEAFRHRHDESHGMVFLRFESWLRQVLSNADMARRQGLVVCERPHLRGGAATHVLVGLMAHIERVCAERRVENTTVATRQLKKFAVGRGNADKRAMLDAAMERWPGDHWERVGRKDRGRLFDLADALWAAQWGLETFESKTGKEE